MSSFKCKSDKVKHSDNVGTLHTMHEKKVTEFASRRNNISDLKIQKESLESELKDIIIQNFPDYRSFLKERLAAQEKLQKINNEIFDIENNVTELDYYCKAEDILFAYYNDNNNNNNSNLNSNKLIHVDYTDSTNANYSDVDIADNCYMQCNNFGVEC